MLCHVHFAADVSTYRQIIEILSPFEDELKYKFVNVTQSLMDKIISRIWTYRLCERKRESLREFILGNKQGILEHIAALRRDKNAVIIHDSVASREQFFVSVAQVMIPYKTHLVLNLPMPDVVLKTVAKYLNSLHLWNFDMQSLKKYLDHHKPQIWRRISILTGEADPKLDTVAGINGGYVPKCTCTCNNTDVPPTRRIFRSAKRTLPKPRVTPAVPPPTPITTLPSLPPISFPLNPFAPQMPPSPPLSAPLMSFEPSPFFLEMPPSPPSFSSQTPPHRFSFPQIFPQASFQRLMEVDVL